MKKVILGILILCFLNSCITRTCKLSVWKNRIALPAGTIKITDNLFMDQTEIRNIDYLQFLDWTKKVFGADSKEYIQLLPDSTVWNEFRVNYAINYNNDQFRESAVVGISYAQAKEFCKWRSDRVMELFLIREGFIHYDPMPTRETFFTIRKYFSGDYSKFYIFDYPEYDLPDSNTFLYASKISDSLINATLNKHSRRHYSDFLEERCLENIAGKSNLHALTTNPIKNIKMSSKFLKKGILIDLKGNVRELTSDSTLVFGKSFIDSCIKSNEKVIFNKNTGANYYTGFRCVCKYKKWELND